MNNNISNSTGFDNSSYISSYKFVPPLPLAAAIQRAKLLSSLVANHFSAVVIQGPAGHGKTTLMQQIFTRCQEADVITSWLTLDPSDNDISRFSACFNALLINALNLANNSTLPITGPASGDGAVENILQLLEAIEGEAAFFIDEFQVISEPVNLSLFSTVIERCPPNITFYIGSRSIPGLARGKLLISGQLKRISPEELCFSTEEIIDFLENVGLEISYDEADTFKSQTGGWPAVLQLIHLALKGGTINRDTLLSWVKGCLDELADYLADNVMLELPEDKQQFLLKTSLLNRLTPALCETITGIANTEQMLKDFVSQGLFIRAIDSEKKWFKYHSLFSGYLKNSLSHKDPDAVATIHCMAADWFRSEGFSEEAFYHALKAEKFELAADILDDWAAELISSARLQTMGQYCALLPDEVFDQRPLLCWGRTWAEMFFPQQKDAHKLLNSFEQSVKNVGPTEMLSRSILVMRSVEAYVDDDPHLLAERLEKIPVFTGEMPQYHCFEMGGLANLRAIHYLQTVNFAQARESALLSEALSLRGNAPFSGAYSISFVAFAMIQEGNLLQAIKLLREGLNKSELKIQGSVATAPLSAIYGFALYEAGNFIEAESHLRDNIETISKTLQVDWLIIAHMCIARTSAHTENDNKKHIEQLDRAEKVGLIRKRPRLVQAAHRERIQIALQSGDCEQASLLASTSTITMNTQAPDGYFHLAEACSDDIIHSARMNIYCGDANKALTSLTSAIEHATSTGWVRRKIKLLILKSLLLRKIDEDVQARSLLTEALELAAPSGYVALFIDEGAQLLDYLLVVLKEEAISKQPQISNFITRVLQTANYDIDFLKSDQVDQSECDVVEKLTKRELDILQLVITGASNKEIADKLFVSYNTVKFHMKNLYGKLGANNRVNLITIAREKNVV